MGERTAFIASEDGAAGRGFLLLLFARLAIFAIVGVRAGVGAVGDDAFLVQSGPLILGETLVVLPHLNCVAVFVKSVGPQDLRILDQSLEVHGTFDLLHLVEVAGLPELLLVINLACPVVLRISALVTGQITFRLPFGWKAGWKHPVGAHHGGHQITVWSLDVRLQNRLQLALGAHDPSLLHHLDLDRRSQLDRGHLLCGHDLAKLLGRLLL